MPRREFSVAVKKAAWDRAGGICECGCGVANDPKKSHLCTPLPCQTSLSAFLKYDPETGLFQWGTPGQRYFQSYQGWRMWLGKWAGKPAFIRVNNRYFVAQLLGRKRLAHRVAWKIVKGNDPGVVDHINGDPFDNRFRNLREVSFAQNSENRAIRSDNSSGVTGVQRHSDGRWRATIYSAGRRRHLGLFEEIEDAVAARKAAEIRLNFLTRGGQ